MKKTPAELAQTMLKKRDDILEKSAVVLRPSVFGKACEDLLAQALPFNKATLLAELRQELERSNAIFKPGVQSAIDLLQAASE